MIHGGHGFRDRPALRLLWRVPVCGWQVCPSIGVCFRREPAMPVRVVPLNARLSIRICERRDPLFPALVAPCDARKSIYGTSKRLNPVFPVRVNDIPTLASDCAESRIALPNDIAHERHGEDDIDNGLRLHP